jgi:hypothetical protein
MSEPTAGRVPKGDETVSLKTSIGKKTLTGAEEMARMIYGIIVINGAQHCRPHLLSRCHLCEADHRDVNEDADEERDCLGLRPAGDVTLNQRADKWGDLTSDEALQSRLQMDVSRQKHGSDCHQTNPEKWHSFMAEAKESERQLNDEFLADEPQVSQRCHWACQDEVAPEELSRCAGCRIVKCCCKDHQAKDWAWEHRGECKLPQFLVDEHGANRLRNLAGDCRKNESDDMQLSSAMFIAAFLTGRFLNACC